ncbi:choice-of-anchor D domain-containing protein [candidate division KSB1 bacterium]|nr:choice-of-anchor D domain-containing protein [candidate division KSB1 bacterium]
MRTLLYIIILSLLVQPQVFGQPANSETGNLDQALVNQAIPSVSISSIQSSYVKGQTFTFYVYFDNVGTEPANQAWLDVSIAGADVSDQVSVDSYSSGWLYVDNYPIGTTLWSATGQITSTDPLISGGAENYSQSASPIWIKLNVKINSAKSIVIKYRGTTRQILNDASEDQKDPSSGPPYDQQGHPAKTFSITIVNSSQSPVSIPILAYHKIDTSSPSQWWVTTDNFAKQVEFIYGYGLTPIKLNQIYQYINSGTSLPSSPIVISVDDGYQNFYTQAVPVLKKFGFTAENSIITSKIGNSEATRQNNSWDYDEQGYVTYHLIWPEILEMQNDGFSFQSHSRTHPDLTSLSASELWSEINGSKDDLESHLGTSVNFFCYPFAQSNETVKQNVINAGYWGGLWFGDNFYNTATGDIFYMERQYVYPTTTLSDFIGQRLGIVLNNVPIMPTGLTATANSSNSIQLTWQDNSTNETNFRIEYRVGTGGVWTFLSNKSANSTTHVHTNVTSGVTYYYRVRSYNGSGSSPYCFPANASTLASPADIAVTPTSLNFGDVIVNASADLSVEVKNLGESTLYVSSSSISGTNSGMFSIISGGGAFNLDQNQTRTIQIRFTPTSSSSKSAGLYIYSDDPDENPISVSLSGNGVTAPDISVSPMSLAFGNVLINSNSDLSVQVRNDGQSILHVSSVSTVGTNASMFTILSGGGAFNLDQNQTRTIQIRFIPTSSSDKSAELRIYSDDPDENPLSVALTGTGLTAPDITVTPTTLAFGDVLVNSSSDLSVEVRNDGESTLRVSSVSTIGTNASMFAILSGGGAFNLTQSQTRTIQIRFTPTSSSDKSAELQLYSDDPDENPVSVSLTGKGLTPPDISVNTTSFAFGDVVVNSHSDITLQVSNVGESTLHVSAASITGTNASMFTVVTGGGAFNLSQNQTRNIQVRFTPTSTSSKAAVLQLTSDDPDESPLNISLTGNGIVAPTGQEITVTPDVLAFGNVLVASSLEMSLEVRNDGESTLHVSSVSLTGTDAGAFTIVSGGGAFNLVQNQTRTIQVKFAPTAETSMSAALRIVSDDADEGQLDVALTGTGIPVPTDPDIAVTPSTLEFGNISVQSSLEMSLEIKNEGETTLHVSAVSLDGTDAIMFSITSGGGAFNLEQDQTRNIRIRFSPTSTGNKVAALQITSDDPDENPKTVALTGTGVSGPDITVTPTSLNFGSVVVQSYTDLSLEIRNDGGSTLHISSVTISGGNAEMFTIVSGGGAFNIESSQTHNLQLRFAPTSLSTQTAELNINSDDPDENPKVVSLTGTGITGPNITASPSSLAFGDVVVNSSSDKILEVKNEGQSALHVSSVGIAGTNANLFTIISGGGSFNLENNQTHTIQIRFIPTSQSDANAQLQIFSDDADQNPLNVSLSGKGIAGVVGADIAVTPIHKDFSNVTVGSSSSSETFVISNAGTTNLEISAIALTGTNASEFTIMSGAGSVTLSPSETHDVVVQFHPNSQGVKSASVQITSNDTDENPLHITLTGTGVSNPPVADFMATTTSGNAPLNVLFIDQSTGDITSWSWSFPGGTPASSTASDSILVNYATAGVYTVSLTVNGANGSDTNQKVDFITVNAGSSGTTTITNVPPSSANAEQALEIVAGISSDVILKSITLYSKMGGERTYRATPMELQNGTNYQAAIPTEYITERGILYYIEMIDQSDVVSYSPSGGIPNYVPVRMTSLTSEATSVAKSYRMISVPFDLDDKSPGNVLIDDFGAYNKTVWRLFRFQNDRNYEFSVDDIESFEPGKAFWLITKDAQPFDVSAGQSVRVDQDFTIQLNAGWNMIGNPFPFPVAWSDVKKNTTIEANGPWTYNGVNNNNGFTGNQTVLMPWDGYAINARSSGTITIPPLEAPTTLPKQLALFNLEPDANSIILKLKVRANGYSDDENYAGLLPNAIDGLDDFDFHEPPVIGNYISLYFQHENGNHPGKFAGDFCPYKSGETSWDFYIATNIANAAVDLEIEPLANLPEGWHAYVLDKNSQNSLSVPDVQKYRYTSDSGNNLRTFKLIISSDEIPDDHRVQIPETVYLQQNYPNPFNSQTVIEYRIPDDMAVSLVIYNLLGDEVRKLVNHKQQSAGEYRVVWDATNQNGDVVPTGVYIAKLVTRQASQVKKILFLK